MQDIFGSVRRSLVFKSTSGGGGEDGGLSGFVERIGSSIRKSRIGLISRPSIPSLPPPSKKDDAPPIRWRKGELIGCGAFGRVYMGMNLDSGELLAVKQVSIAASSASKEKTQAHIRELEEEVKLLKNLSHLNIVRYLGTAREDDSLNILLEFVPGGSISSLLGKFGSFPESVIRMYTKQLLLGLEYLHKNGIMHRDIKGANILVDNKGCIKLADFGASKKVVELGANILVDNKGCIKLADFGASKKVVELATINGAKSMKGTPYWMAPEVILQTGHSFSADIWSVGCTVIEMATGKPPWSQQYQEVAALFHIGTTKSHPPIPEHLSVEAKDFLLKCLQEVPNLRPAASELLQHPFVTGEYQETHSVFRNSVRESGNLIATTGLNRNNFMNSVIRRSTCAGLKDVCEMGSVKSSTVYHDNLSRSRSYWGAENFDDDMCLIDDKDDFAVSASTRFKPTLASADLNKSFNPMCEPLDDWPCKFDEDPLFKRGGYNLSCSQSNHDAIDIHEASGKGQNNFTFPCVPVVPEDDDEVTDSKIRAFLDEKALDLKKLQTPLYEEFYNRTLNTMGAPTAAGTENSENPTHLPNLPLKSRSPKRWPSRRLSAVVAPNIASPGRDTNHIANESIHNRALQEIQPPQLSEWKEFLHDGQQETLTSSTSFSERQRKWEEELYQELERKREMIRLAGVGGKTSSPKDLILMQQRERFRFAFTGK